MNKRNRWVLGLFLFMSACASKEPEEVLVPKEETTPTVSSYQVDIKGSVEKPGVYEVVVGARVMDVIKEAGGLTKDANTEFLNLSRKVEDGDVIWVYTNEEIKQFKDGKTTIEYIETTCQCPDVSNSACLETEKEQGEKININTASKEELMTLSGIGEAKAEAILEYRKHNRFEKIEDIKNISGIGDNIYDKIKDSITV